jgi:hypothetical protein
MILGVRPHHFERIMTTLHHGSCLCGDVRFDVEGDFDHFFLCHCEHCRKDTGSAHAANLFSATAKLKWLAGESRVASFNLPATRHARSFCSHCGSALPNVQLNGQLLVVPAGSLNSEVAIKPTAHIFVASRASWDRELEKTPMIDRLPP